MAKHRKRKNPKTNHSVMEIFSKVQQGLSDSGFHLSITEISQCCAFYPQNIKSQGIIIDFMAEPNPIFVGCIEKGADFDSLEGEVLRNINTSQKLCMLVKNIPVGLYKRMCKGMVEVIDIDAGVYFLLGLDTGRIKIGYSKNVRKRVRSLQLSENAHTLCVFEGSQQDEKAFHKQFEQHRVVGEWFESNPELLEFISEIKLEQAINAGSNWHTLN